MRMKGSGLLTFSLVILVSLRSTSIAAELAVAQDNTSDCHEIASLISKLRSKSEIVRESAKESILVISKKSADSRQCTIKKMSDIAATPNTFSDRTLFLKYPEIYVVWKEAIDILGTMKAIEAIDVIIDCLDCNDGRSDFGIGHYPATKGVVKFGDSAIPSLERALTQKPRGIRGMVVQALREIGGQRAREILVRTLKAEKDPLVADWIRNLLLGWNTSSSGKT